MKSGVHLLYILLGSLIISSCQREISEDIPGSSNNNSCSGTLLTKLISKGKNDSTITEFEYDAKQRLIKESNMNFHPLNSGINDMLISRDANGVITRVKTVGHSQQGSDSTDAKVFYDYTNRRYTYIVEQITFSGYITTDSVVFLYDAAGKLTGQHVYVHHFEPGPYYLLDAKYEYTYDNTGNVSKFTVYSRDQTTNLIELEVTYEYTYDKKKRALQFDPVDEVIIFGTVTSSSQNVISVKVTDVKFPVYTGTYSEQFTYNSCDKPTTMLETFSASSDYRKLQYFYK